MVLMKKPHNLYIIVKNTQYFYCNMQHDWFLPSYEMHMTKLVVAHDVNAF